MERGKSGPSASVREEKKQENEEGFDYEEEGFDEMDQENRKVFENFNPGPLLPLKDQIEKDKEDESLRRWKEKLLGCLESDLNGQMEPEVQFQSIGIISSDFVLHNIVSGLAYTNTVWKSGLQVDQSKGMLGTFAPQREPYVHTLEEKTTPSGMLARGIYTAKLQFQDDDNRCHLELDYSFEIQKSS
ncbi:unnamed protein product [Fraxinus pennsylvanica]|uniref:Uncharacterized protein n=1 Tax=Fraxinus pennsylvanica TaxID=56036 RepID=A0AAD1ZIS0_9LAMI|nr:unnamed protein product [Fraxinus pennsylvanica]